MQRNFDGIQFEKLRKEIDPKFNTIHDELSDCYYNGKSFKTFGILTKEKFDKLHSLIFLWYDVTFHTENLKQLPKDIISPALYDEIKNEIGTVVITKSGMAITKINELKSQGFDLVIK